MLKRPARRASSVVLATVVAAVLFTALGANAFPFGILKVTYVGCTGLTLTPDPFPTGNYLVVVNNPDNCPVSLSLTGPGVNLSVNTGAVGPFGPYNFQVGATYTASDSNSSASVTFTPTPAGSPSSTGAGASTSGVPARASSSSPRPSSSVTSLGTLAGSISPTGKAGLTIDGSTVNKLKAGVYKLVVSDHSKKAGLIIQALGYAASDVSGVSGTGTTVWSLRVIRGKYFFRATGGPKTFFTAH